MNPDALAWALAQPTGNRWRGLADAFTSGTTRVSFDGRTVEYRTLAEIGAALAAYCTACARWVQAERAIAEMGKRDMLTGGLLIKTSNGNAIQNPLVGTANKAASDMVRYAAEFGMTPSARANTTARVPIRKVEALLPATGTSVRPGIRARSARAWSAGWEPCGPNTQGACLGSRQAACSTRYNEARSAAATGVR